MVCVVEVGTVIEPPLGEGTYWQPVPQEIISAVDQVNVPEATPPKEIVVEVLDDVTPLKVTLQDVPLASPLSVKVTV